MSVDKHAMQKPPSHIKAAAGIDDEGKTSATGKGCITKCFASTESTFKQKDHGNYRRHGYNHIKGNGGKNAFLLGGYLSPATKPATWTEDGYGKKVKVSNPNVKPTAFAFTGQNYVSANAPFVHNYHHIMPWNSLKGALDNKLGILLQKSGYNLNAGDNLMILPKRSPTALFIGCYNHPSNHKDYNEHCATAVKTVVGEIRNYIQNNTTDHDINDSNVGMLKKSLEAWQTTEYTVIVAAGRAKAGIDIKDHVPSPIAAVTS